MVPEDSTLERDKTLYIYSQYLLVTRHHCKLDGIPENVISSKQEMYTRYMETSLFVHSCCVLPQVPFMAIRILDGQWESQTAKFKRMARCSMYGCTEIILISYRNCPWADALSAWTTSACRLSVSSQGSLLQQLCHPLPPAFSRRHHILPDILKPQN